MAFWVSSFGTGSVSAIKEARNQGSTGWLYTLPWWVGSMNVGIRDDSYCGFQSGSIGSILRPGVTFRGHTISQLYSTTSNGRLVLALSGTPSDRSDVSCNINGAQYTLVSGGGSTFTANNVGDVFRQYVGVSYLPIELK